MNLYSQFIMPRLLDWSMSDASLSNYRQQVLAQVSGETLEIGFGTGLNLPYYPKHIKKLITVDANPGMNALALKRIQASDIVVEHNVLSGENLPFASQSFDSVVTTWTLCSIANVEQALKEIYRVLKPQGRYFFIEHGLSNDAKVQVWQNRLTPIQKVIADGCHLNRDIKHLVENHFSHLTIEQFYSENLPKILGYLYKGVALKQ
ncbi:class I SAM-dependent methyltransferase [Hassallia byssoidea VB512170]|uniref:Class I SAM-dependent methyltransferase n=1 Tax=Hassallia byssoidea VB512170 TaxID=1304833 RepID=A0A846HB89_9CYAN|nr:class I SAM-dependent methyltransferase [Hassalia byssoidea]NEU74168.1 class I SAM-dependent methyltransferase [Hassalia byssoidea VB512170]